MKRLVTGSIPVILLISVFAGNVYSGSITPVKKITSNGITIIYKHNPANEVVSINMFVKGGQRNEPDKKAGIAMLAQSLVTRGTKRRSAEQIAVEIESCGGHLSASASEDYLLFNTLVTVDSIETGFDLISDIIINPTFPNDEFQKEKNVQYNAVKTRTEHISTAASDALVSQLYQKHSYGRPLSGSLVSLDLITRDDVNEWYAKEVTPDKAVFVVVGKSSFAEINALIKKYFSPWKKYEGQKPVILPVIIEPVHNDFSENLSMEFKQAYLMHAYLAPNSMHKDYAALKLLNEILGGGMSRRLFQKFREEKPYVYSVGSYYPSRIEMSRFVFYMGLDADHVKDADQELRSMIKDVQDNPIDARELTESQKHLIGTYRMAHQSNQSQGWYLGFWEILGHNYSYDARYTEKIAQVTAEDVKRVANTYLGKGSVTITIMRSPKK